MMRPLTVGVTPLERRRDVIVRLACRAEELGYSGFYVAEGWSHDASVLLTEIAMRTSRIEIGTGILNVWGRSAATLAMLATSLHAVSGGRFVLGLGAGSPPLAEGFHDVPFRAPVKRLADTTRQVRRLLDGERLAPTVASETKPLRLGAPAATRIPISLAALGPNSVAVAGELADSWSPFLVPVSALDAATQDLKVGAARAGRSLPQICPAVPTAVSADRAEAMAMASWWVVFYLTSMGPLYPNMLRRHGFGAAVDAVLAAPGEMPPRELLDELVLWGTAEDARAGLDAWYAAGADQPSIVLPPNRDVAELEALLEGLSPNAPI